MQLPSRSLFGKFTLGLVLAAALPFASAHAATFRTLHRFTWEGQAPSGLFLDSKNNLFVTLASGGLDGVGSMLKLPPGGIVKPLHDFRTKGAGGPNSPLLRNQRGNFVGIADQFAGEPNSTIYEIGRDGHHITVLHKFDDDGGARGFSLPPLLADKVGNFYGALHSGGTLGLGLVFKLAPDGTMTVLHNFAGGSDGAYSYSGVVSDRHGNFYGSTVQGGTGNLGTVFKIAPDGKETILHSFSGATDGAGPMGALTIDKLGNLYGTASYSGPNNLGLVFKIAPDGAETILHSFNGIDGSDPQAGLLADQAGNLYGTTSGGGANADGVVFQLSPDNTFTILYDFTLDDGHAGNYVSLIRDKSGNLYGVTGTELYEIEQ